MKRLLIALVTLGAGCAFQGEGMDIGAQAQAITAVSAFGDNPGQLSMFVHEPPGAGSGRPLVVALHGCTMTAEQYANAGWNEVADELDLYVVYPEQNKSVNNSYGCFNWGGSWAGAPSSFVLSSTPLAVDDIRRGGPEVTSIVSMVQHMISTGDVDPARVYVTGLSAGGGMAAVLLATYPDVFKGGQVVAGIPYGCATERATTGEATACTQSYLALNAYLDRSPEQWAQIVAEAGAPAGAEPPLVSIWHGTMDFIVNQQASAELTEQWVTVHGGSMTPSATEEHDGATREVYEAGGRAVVERWTVPGMGHGTPIDSANGCGTTSSYINDAGICSARHAATFFGLDSEDAPSTPTTPPTMMDPTAPVVAFTSPANGAFVDGVVALQISATDPDGIERVELFVDDVPMMTLVAAPYEAHWDTVALAEGVFRIRADAYDTSGAVGSAVIQLVVDRPGGSMPTLPPSGETPSTPMTPPASGGETPAPGDVEPTEGASVAGCQAGPGRSGAGALLFIVAALARRRRSRSRSL